MPATLVNPNRLVILLVFNLPVIFISDLYNALQRLAGNAKHMI